MSTICVLPGSSSSTLSRSSPLPSGSMRSLSTTSGIPSSSAARAAARSPAVRVVKPSRSTSSARPRSCSGSSSMISASGIGVIFHGWQGHVGAGAGGIPHPHGTAAGHRFNVDRGTGSGVGDGFDEYVEQALPARLDAGPRAELRRDGGALQRDAGHGRERPHRLHHHGHYRTGIRIGGGLGQGGEREEGVREALDPPALLLQAREVLPNGSLVGRGRAPEELELDVDRAQGATY